MRHGIGDSHAISVQLTYARREAWGYLLQTDRVRALRAVRDEVLPMAEKLRMADPESFETQRDALAVLLNECALAVVDEETRPPVTGFDAVHVRRIDPHDVDALLDAGLPGERPVIQQLFRGALDVVKDPVLREVITANQQGVRILQRANHWIRMLTDAMDADVVAADAMDADVVAAEGMGAEVMGADVVAADVMGADAMGSEAVGSDVMGADAATADTMDVGATEDVADAAAGKPEPGNSPERNM
ncbi:hypothetical protein E0500_018625 [Streptomyces sp. KM273126]|uniref:hypothetical protein n=1 Tax=Streptomyces sp. KM273126 TaxID=2545247 RepID=UPI00103ABA23|nr:hypothetical protein [Streptomyces sp. KM273126]MBA2809355.1 hypothetical protein [Streptomyces sp. KM273126]